MSLNPDIYVGLDFSLTSPGMCAFKRHPNGKLEIIDTYSIKTKKDEGWFTRRNRIKIAVTEFVFKHDPEMVIVENYSFGSTNGRELAGEVHGICLYSLIEQGYPEENIFRIVAPRQLKKFITGNGNAKKKQVVKSVNDYFGLSLKDSENDIADAIVLAFLGYCIRYYTQIEQNLNETQREVVQKLIESMGEETL